MPPSKIFKVYVAAPYGCLFAQEAFKLLRAKGIEPCGASPAPDLTDGKQVVRRWNADRMELINADAVLVIAESGGTEMYAVIEQARSMFVPIFWCGELTLSAFDPAVKWRFVELSIGSLASTVSAIRHRFDES